MSAPPVLSARATSSMSSTLPPAWTAVPARTPAPTALSLPRSNRRAGASAPETDGGFAPPRKKTQGFAKRRILAFCAVYACAVRTCGFFCFFFRIPLDKRGKIRYGMGQLNHNRCNDREKVPFGRFREPPDAVRRCEGWGCHWPWSIPVETGCADCGQVGSCVWQDGILCAVRLSV